MAKKKATQKSNGVSQEGSRDDLLEFAKRTNWNREQVYLPRVGRHYWVWEIEGPDVIAFEQSLWTAQREADEKTFTLKQQFHRKIACLCSMAIRDAEGKRTLFTEEELSHLPGGVLDPAFEVACRLSNILQGGGEDAEEPVGKSSGTGPDSTKTSESPSDSATDLAESSQTG